MAQCGKADFNALLGFPVTRLRHDPDSSSGIAAARLARHKQNHDKIPPRKLEMKKLFLLSLLLSAIRLSNNTAEGATVTNYITDGFGTPLNTRVIITPFTISTVFGGTNVLGPSAGFGCTNGFWQANLLGGFYYVDQGLAQPTIAVWATPGDGQTNSLAYFASAATNPIPSFFSSGTGVMYVTNVITTTGSLTASNIYSTNIIYQASQALTNNWGGPTNVLDLSFADQEYTAFTPCAVTGVINKGSTTVNTATLTILNSSATNITLTFSAAIETKDGLRQRTIPAGQDFITSIRYHPATVRTNEVDAAQF